MAGRLGSTIDPSGRYRLSNVELGRGAYKVVYKAFDTHLAIEVAWNKLSLKRLKSSEVDKVSREVELLKSLDHPSIISCFSSWETTDESGTRVINFITELMMSGTLKDYLTEAKEIKIMVIRRWCKNVLDGIACLHTRSPPIMHRDIKCDNIFINGHVGEVKIGDLGLSGARVNPKAVTVIGTPEFMAPELYEEQYTEKVDIYSFGMCIVEMLTSEYPYSECHNPAQIFKRVSNGILPNALSKIKDCPLKEIIVKCLAKEADRPSAVELLQDPVFKDWQSDEGILTTSDLVILAEGDDEVASGTDEVSLPKKLSPVFRQAEGINREILITKTPTVESTTKTTPLLPADVGEIRIGIHIPVDGCTRRIEFGYDPLKDSIDVLAEEMVAEFNIGRSYVEKVRAEILGQVLASKSSVHDPSRDGLGIDCNDISGAGTLSHPVSSLATPTSGSEAVPESSTSTREPSPRAPREGRNGKKSAVRTASNESEMPSIVVIGRLASQGDSGRSGIYRQKSDLQNRPESNGSVVSVRSDLSTKGFAKPNAPLNEKEFALNQSLMDNAAKGRIDKVLTKLSQGASALYADYDRRTALHLAATEGHAHIAKVLIEAGAVIDARDRWGSTPLRDAKQNNCAEVLKVLEEYSPPDDDGDDSSDDELEINIDGRRLLVFSARGDICMVREIIMAGAGIHYKDYDGRTALHLAASEGHLDVADLLLLNGADATKQDRYGRSPLDDARASGHRSVYELLTGARRLGATPPGSTLPSPPPTPLESRVVDSGVVNSSCDVVADDLASEAAFALSMNQGGHMAEIVEKGS